MKKISIALFSLSLLAGITVNASADEKIEKGYESNGVVEFVPNLDPTDPVDPTNPDPEKPVKPVDPTNPEGPNPGTAGPLSIDYASSLDFGLNQISNKTKTYYARAQKYYDETGKERNYRTPNYVQISDNRGTNEGWVLKVKQNGQFKNDATKHGVLTGSEISLINPEVASNIQDVDAPTAVSEIKLDSEGAEAIVMAADLNAGAGTWVNRWGNVETVTEKNKENEDVEVYVTKAIALTILGKTPKDAVKYETTLTWTLSEIPEN